MEHKSEKNFKYKPLIIDGAIGSLLQQNKVYIHPILWSSYANLISPEEVKKVHSAYISAGADIITTNTFRTNPISFHNSSLNIDYEDFVAKSVKLAKDLTDQSEGLILAGSNAPAEDCYQKERNVSKSKLESNHKKHIELLWKYGCDFVLNETQSHLDEIEIICEYCYENKIEYVISFYFDENRKILSGEDLNSIIKDVMQYSPKAIGFNCIFNDTFNQVFSNLDLEYKWGFYLNCGGGKLTDKNIVCGVDPSQYLESIKYYLDKKPYFLGSCCGSIPGHISKIREFIDENY